MTVSAIYGNEDGLFDENSLSKIKDIVGEKKFILVNNSSHNVFVDQQKIFFEALNNLLKISESEFRFI